MEFDKKTLIKFAKLSKIMLTEAELEKYTPQMQSILDSVKTLEEIDLSKVVLKPRNSIKLAKLRDDIAKPSQVLKDSVKNAPFSENGYVKVWGSTFGTEDAA